MIDNIRNTFDQPKEKWVETFARVGLAAKGVVYCLLGVLAFMSAFDMKGSEDASQHGTFRVVLEQPFGRVLVAIIAFGLLGYVMWRFIQAVKDPEGKGSDAKGIAARLAYAGSGLIYLGLSYYAATLIFRNLPSGGADGGGGNGGGGQVGLVSKLLEQPFGQWLVGLFALGIIGKGIFQLYRAISGNFKKDVDERTLSYEKQKLFDRAGRFGYTSRAVVLGILGYFFMRAAIEANPGEAKDTSGAFDFLEQSPFGPWLLGLVAVGLIGYGVFMFIKSKYQIMDPLG